MHPNDLSNERSWHLGNKAVGLMHVCKCTCFTTNTTLIPLYVPQRPGDLCSTCTKQFCVERAEGCRGAQIAEGNDDTGTGFEGQVWAKCFIRDPTKDQTIVLLYLIAVLGLLLVAFLRSRAGHAMLTRARRVLRL
ncbi:uncharacterized protein MJAP1_002395 [Malassezia japonica]|uniref:Uncharacterized protein n=1 Tax=Malassezia japonica TaxID=223818 RepID=A0AAF0JAF6_9BASI|nr:uncharacterized protein MJAP1_002395 [Malassezia japonica]WFD39418.1 hypothetical protein MJAP1_002395 [Malassezia japonica]